MPQSDSYSRWYARALAWLGAIPDRALRALPSSASFSSPAGLTVVRFGTTRLRAGALATLLPLTIAHADPILDHDVMVQQLIEQQHANPLVADCAAHAAFVVPTSHLYDHVEFLPAELDDQHASIEAWNQPFDDRKQRVNVETLVRVSGLGYRKNAGEAGQPDLLHFRCGYVQDKLLAFGYNEPEQASPPAGAPVSRSRGTRNRASSSRHATRGKAAHATSRRGTTTKTRSSAKSTAKSGAKAPAKSSKAKNTGKSRTAQ
ncbi:hypothetical protein JOE11_001494 [Robbsia andropogonis]|uniref:BspC domain-containing protein n=1 Tax=Robbsia andropogonis TaxID=28092 RepID=UPI003D1D1BDD